MERSRSGGDEDDGSPQNSGWRTARRADSDAPPSVEGGRAGNQLDVMAEQVLVNGSAHRPGDIDRPRSESIDGRLGMQIDALTVDVAALESRQVESRFTHRLGGQGAGSHRSTKFWFPLDDCDTLSEVGGLRGRLFPRRSGPDDHHVEVVFH